MLDRVQNDTFLYNTFVKLNERVILPQVARTTSPSNTDKSSTLGSGTKEEMGERCRAARALGATETPGQATLTEGHHTLL